MEGRRSRSSAKGVSRLPKNEGDKPEPWKAVKKRPPCRFFTTGFLRNPRDSFAKQGAPSMALCLTRENGRNLVLAERRMREKFLPSKMKKS